jgi:hypothetical protein
MLDDRTTLNKYTRICEAFGVFTVTNSSKMTITTVQFLSYYILALLLRYKDKNILITTVRKTSEIQRITKCLKNNG